jgi:hyaluronan synthase
VTRQDERRQGALHRALGLAPLAGLCAGIAVLMWSWGAEGARERIALAWSHPMIALVVVEAFYLSLQTALWLRYRPAPALADTELPRLSVIIPAFNEGPMVEQSIRSVANAAYPRDRLEIIVVDDGSRDDTLFHMRKLRRMYPELVRVLHFPGNQGKRAALRAGFLAASGDVVLTVDSDSEMAPLTLKRMVAPFADPRVGAVAGRIRVLNRDTFIGRMLDVQFTLSFDFARAAQSTYGTVMVCPGALSAFRRAVILPHLGGWMDQRFLGRPVGHGEDQALTNIVLRAGYDTVYQSDANVRTLVPDGYRQLSRMLVRWERSFIVEGFSFARFMLRRSRPRGRLLPAIAFACSNLRVVLLFVALVQIPGLLLGGPGLLSRFLMATAVAAVGSAFYYLRTERSLRFLYGAAYALYSLTLLQWILPWALLTVRDERWGTR